MTPPSMAAVVACADLVNRAGGTGFEIAWTCPHVPDEEDDHNCPGVMWNASAQWRGHRLIGEAPDPNTAAVELAGKLLEGGHCRCGQRATVTDGGTGCRWRLEGERWEPSCDAPPVPMPGGRGDLPKLLGAMNREQRRRNRRNGR